MATKKKQTHEEIIDEQFKLAQKNAEIVWSLVDDEIPEPKALLNYQNKPVIFNNTNIVIQGKPGTHKSRFAAALISLFLSDEVGKQLYGFSKESDLSCRALYIDTERNKNHQLPLMVKQIIKETKLGKEAVKKRLTLLPFSEITRDSRLFVMGKQVDLLQGSIENKDPLIIIMDIVTDFVRDFNSVESTNLINDVINFATSKFDATFIVIIHENPGEGEKARGHVGTEITNKASTVFQISEVKNMKEVFRIKMLKSRSTQKYDEVLLKFDPALNNLAVVTDDDILAKASDPEAFKLGLSLAKKMFLEIERKELLEYLEKDLRWSTRKIEEKLKKFVDSRIEFETALGPTVLTKERGQSTVYKMVPLNLPGTSETNLEGHTCETNNAI